MSVAPFRYLVQFLCNHQKNDMQFSPVGDVQQDFEIFCVPANCICKENILNFISFLVSYFVYNLHLISSSIFQQNSPFRLHLTPFGGFRRKERQKTSGRQPPLKQFSLRLLQQWKHHSRCHVQHILALLLLQGGGRPVICREVEVRTERALTGSCWSYHQLKCFFGVRCTFKF